jgi:hypothetical protein
MDDIDPAFNPARKTGQRLSGIASHLVLAQITILSTLPSAGVGALAILMLFGFD